MLGASSADVTYGDYIKVKDKIYAPIDRRRRGWARIGREEEGTSSFRAELAALLMLLREASDEEDVVALLDCKSEITEVGKWVGEGAKATLLSGNSQYRHPREDHREVKGNSTGMSSHVPCQSQGAPRRATQ